MGNVPVLSAAGATIYLKASGAGSDADPHIPQHAVTGTVTANIAAGANNIGDVDVLTVVGDNVDMDSGVGSDEHALVAVGLPADGGHVVGGTGANPFRVDPTASTVQPVSVASFYVPLKVEASMPNVSPMAVASWFPGADVVASVVGFPAVTASIPNTVGVSVASFYAPLKVEASMPNVSPVSVASWFVGAQVVASTIGTLFAVVNTGAVGTQYAEVNTQATVNVTGTLYAVVNTGAVGTQYNIVSGSVNVLGNVLASIPDVPSISIASFYVPLKVEASIPNVSPFSVASWYSGADVVASVVGYVGVTATIPNVPSVSIASAYAPITALASLPQVSKMAVASWFPGAGVVASVVGVAGVLASIPNVASIKVASWFPGADVVASVVGNAAVTATIAGLPSVAVASFLPYIRPYTVGSQWAAVARVQASVNNAAAISAKGAGVYNYVSALSVVNAAASYGGVVNLCDGSATIWTGYAAPAGGGVAVSFPQGLKPAANATLFVAVPVYSLDLYVAISGFQGP